MLKIFKKYVLSADELTKLITDAYFSGVATQEKSKSATQEKSKSYYEVTLADGKEVTVSASNFAIEKYGGFSITTVLSASFYGTNKELVAYIENVKQVIKIEFDEDKRGGEKCDCLD